MQEVKHRFAIDWLSSFENVSNHNEKVYFFLPSIDVRRAELLHWTICIALAAVMAQCVCRLESDLTWEAIAGSQLARWIPVVRHMKWWKLETSSMRSVGADWCTQLCLKYIFIVFYFYVGGNDGSSSLNSVERYDVALNKWSIVTSMFIRRSSIGSAVLECFNLERGLLQTAIWPSMSSSASLDVASSDCNNA